MPARKRDGDTGNGINRRQYLYGAGAAALTGLAGCSGDGSGGGSTATEASDDGGTATDSGSNSESGGPIPIGNLSPFSGGLGWIGPNSRRGVDTALNAPEGVNQAKVLGRTVEIHEQDTETKPQSAISGFKTLDSQGVFSMVGPSSSVMPSLVGPAQDTGLAIVSPMTGTIQLDEVGGEYIWRTVPSDGVGARAQARYAYNEMGHRKMALAFKNDKGSQSFSAASGDYFKNLGGEVLTEVPLDPAASSYRSEVKKLQDSGAEVVSMTAATEVSGLFIKNYVEAGAEDDFDLLLGNDVLTEGFIEEMGADVMEGMVGQAPAPGPAHDVFLEKHKELHGKAPGAFAASAYDSMVLQALAYQKEGEVTRDAIPNHLYDLGNGPGKKVSTFAAGKKAIENGEEINYVGAGNPQNFDKTGDPLGPFAALQATDGKWKEVKVYSAEDLSK
ncbi:ABC transporter substrate-binding protein [Haloarculaceae archaeon H-GB2-1]|nr:ABC transporter substrate-binding protein [Haloarculaceae archaeon H-GB1-1]MEA5387167.1 ABC transporter substrate-binding protein [Haloarculaceae archaeon H-GB11]MEA5408659.1 ABC transporter substrate-binding protein [Haloarculaceae archaeon H-GB2-1]